MYTIGENINTRPNDLNTFGGLMSFDSSCMNVSSNKVRKEATKNKKAEEQKDGRFGGQGGCETVLLC